MDRSYQRAVLPFAVVACVGFATLLAPPYHAQTAHLAAGGGLLLLTVASAMWAARKPQRGWHDVIAPVLFFPAFAVVRDAAGGATSGLAPLVALPVLWVALYGTARQLVAIGVLTAAVFAGPMLVLGSPGYPLADWRRALIWFLVAVVIGPVVQRVVRERTAEADHARTVSEQLEHLANHDTLTGLVNRRRFNEDLGAHILRGHRYGHHGALLVIDLDNFKQVNDTLGHKVGDQVLVSFAQILCRRVRLSDMVARLGGDEFAVLLLATDRDGAAAVAKAIIEATRADLHVFDPDPARQVSASIGVVMLDHGTTDAEDLLHRADSAMYDAKDAGRDSYVLLPETPWPPLVAVPTA